MDFSDQSHINKVRDALWRPHSSRASVMVGSGFSKNAIVSVPGGFEPPGWQEIIRAMHAELYPDEHEAQLTDSFVAADALDIAQQYKIAFGRLELHRFLRQQVQNDHIGPSDFHRRLLNLPWRDVFSTNWDTLLESTRDQVPSRAYEVVREVDEIPLAQPPRIVKLHGSLPANFPLIVTEEDYRVYPTRFAPFVNTVRQALMETILLLIGFSGRDPNFLHWSGWVRDQLGSSAPQIYAAGWLNLSNHQRRVLERKNVVPIDLARHPQGKFWDQHDRHRLATEWILQALELGKPYPAEEWPKVFDRKFNIPENLKPLGSSAWNEPLLEKQSPPHSDEESPDTAASNQLNTWLHNRKLYPGWLAVPAIRQLTFALPTLRWEETLLAYVNTLELRERLNAIHEVVWRHEVALMAPGPQLIEAAETILRDVMAEGLVDTKTIEAASCVALALVTSARINSDEVGFNKAVDVATRLNGNDSEVQHRLKYEKCLWSLYSLDFESLQTKLSDWNLDSGDPFWKVRVASLMLVLGKRENARSLLESSIDALRRSTTSSPNIPAFSRLAWSHYLLNVLDTLDNKGNEESYRTTMRDFRLFYCDPESDLQSLSHSLGNTETRERGPTFDLGQRRITWSTKRFRESEFSGSEALKSLAAYRAIRLAEVAALLPVAGHWPNMQRIWSSAIKLIHQDQDFELALRLMLLSTTYDQDDLLTNLLSRPKLATMPYDVAVKMTDLCVKVIDYFVGESGNHLYSAISPMERIRVALESLSRLVLRLEPDRTAEIFAKALRYYSMPSICGNPLVCNTIGNLLRRTWEALPKAKRTEFVFEVLNAPIVGVDGFEAQPYGFLDPGQLIDLYDSPMPDRDEDSNVQWVNTVQFLVRSLSFEKDARSRAMLRLVNATMANRLIDQETDQVAQAIWDQRQKSEYGLPGEEDLHQWVFLCMPEPEAGTALNWFRKTWLSSEDESELDDDQYVGSAIYHIGDIIENSSTQSFEFQLTTSDKSYIVQLADRWSQTPVPTTLQLDMPMARSQYSRSLHRVVQGLTSILLHMELPSSVANALYAKSKDLLKVGLYAQALLVGLNRVMPQLNEEISTTFRKGLSTEIEDQVNDTISALRVWLYFSKLHKTDPPPNELVREVGYAIATRRRPAIGPALGLAKWVFESGNNPERDVLRTLTLEGLSFLVHELDYTNIQFKDIDSVPEMRWNCFGIAQAMHDEGREDQVILDWLKNAREDPLPEIRNKASRITL